MLNDYFLQADLTMNLCLKRLLIKSFMRALETTELLYANYRPLNHEATHLFQMWFTLCESALLKSYKFLNPKGLASAADYMFQSARYTGVTKKAMAEKYGISTSDVDKVCQ